MRYPKFKFTAFNRKRTAWHFTAAMLALLIGIGSTAVEGQHVCLEHGEHEAGHHHLHRHVKQVANHCVSLKTTCAHRADDYHLHIEQEECACFVMPLPIAVFRNQVKATGKLLTGLSTPQRITPEDSAFSPPVFISTNTDLPDSTTMRRCIVLLV